MSNFKVGDSVICVDNHNWPHKLQLGKQYTISMIYTDRIAQSCKVVGVDNWFLVERFELVQSPVSNTAHITAQEKLDMIKKWFESGNDVPITQATIRASAFWAIYNA